MKTFTITFGVKGTPEEATHVINGTCIFDELSKLHRNGWITENITEIKIEDAK